MPLTIEEKRERSRAYYLKTRDKQLAYMKKYRQNRWGNKRHETPEAMHNHLMKNYGISYYDYKIMLEKQNNVCAICSGNTSNRRLAVDHCHSTGKVRGLLCVRCNTALGRFKDNEELLLRAIKYLNGE